jgi:toxin FitB
MAWLLDGNFLLERRKPKPEPKVVAFFAAQPLSSLYVSAIGIAEIRFGIELQQDVTQRAELNDWFITHAENRDRKPTRQPATGVSR